MKVVFYKTSSGRSPVVDEIDDLPLRASAHAYEILEEIEKYGFNAPRVIFRHIQGKLWEIKMNLPGSGGFRIFCFSIEKDVTLLLHAYSKKTQKAPRHHIETALQRMADAIRRNV